MTSTSYDEVPYLRLAHAQTHPDRLATMATLLGMEPVAPDRCRVLELGCASGSNLIPMAEALPDASFVGIDVSAREIAEGQAMIAELELGNLDLRRLDILDIGPDLGEFDYVIAHGVYSWVPADVAEALLRVAGRHLAPRGVAYISYNAYPGWHTVGVLRDLLLYHARGVDRPSERAARGRAMLRFLIEMPAEGRGPFAEMLATYAESLTERVEGLEARRDSYLLHDALGELNAPIYFSEFVERAARHGLQYLAEADSPVLMPRQLVTQVRAAFGEQIDGLVELEQYVDFLRGRMFRRTLLCRQEVALQRELDPERIATLQVATRASPLPDAPGYPAGVIRFRSPDGAVLAVDHRPTTAAMQRLTEAWPRTIPFEELIGREARPEDRSLLARNLLSAYCYSQQLVTLRTRASHVVRSPGQRPRVAAATRAMAAETAIVADAYHDSVELDAPTRALVRELDGTRDRAALARPANAAAGPETDPAELDARLQWLCANALLVD